MIWIWFSDRRVHRANHIQNHSQSDLCRLTKIFQVFHWGTLSLQWGYKWGFPPFPTNQNQSFPARSIFPVLGTVYFCLPNQLLLRICTNLFCTANSKVNSKLCKPPFLPVTGQILFSGHLKANLTTALTLYGSLFFQAIGRTLLPPYWSLGFQLSRWGYNKIETVKSLVENMRKYNLPQVCVVFVIAILATTNL